MKTRVFSYVFLLVLGAALASCSLFKPADPPAAPTAYDATQITTDGFQANWSQVPGVSKYYFYLSTNSSFSSYVGDFDGFLVNGIGAVVSGLESGTIYYYRLKCSNSDGTSKYSNTIVVQTLLGPLQLTFNNTVFTPTSITVAGYGTRVVQPGQSTTWSIPQSDGTYTYGATTMGTTNTGTQIGLQIIWGDTNTITGSAYTINLVVSNTYFFIYMKNNGTHSLSPLYVNYGSAYQTMDNIMIPADGVTYNTGYYRALSDGVVRAYWTSAPSSYSYWNYGPSLPGTENQSLTLVNNSKSTCFGSQKTFPANAGENKAESGSRHLYADTSISAVPGNPVAAK